VSDHPSRYRFGIEKPILPVLVMLALLAPARLVDWLARRFEERLYHF